VTGPPSSVGAENSSGIHGTRQASHIRGAAIDGSRSADRTSRGVRCRQRDEGPHEHDPRQRATL